ncbi:zinc finger MYM-type protein 1-like [Mya arenaria]|uniref:zinc finger MYM-type protein 1-like n=1 Tax=Mya arenaria TaxID=6604 RepID=UPI0022DFBFEE|nr:zinc finger MYM-type protein 1-like [Mya arenaria]
MFRVYRRRSHRCQHDGAKALCLRFYDSSKHELCEEFLGFGGCQSTTGEALADAFIANLLGANVQIEKMRGQGYDGAANMSGIHKGVQARISARIPGAVYTHCKAHSLNLAIIHALEEVFARNMMSVVQTIAFAFNYSAKRLLHFNENLNNDNVCREELERRTKLQSLCETRWAARSDALHTFLCSYRTVVTSVEELANNYGDSKAAGYNHSIQNFSFIVTLVAVEHVLSGLVRLSKLLHDKSCDLLEAASEARVVIAMLQAERNYADVWDALYDKSVSTAHDVDVESSVPRRFGRQVHRPNAPAETPSQYWKTNMYLPFVDHLLVDLDARLLKGNGRYKAQYLLPPKVV